MNAILNKEKRDGNLLCVHTNERRYDFNKFTMLEQFFDNIISGKTTIKQAKDEQNGINKEILDLEEYNPTKQDKIKGRSKALKNAKKSF